MHRLGGVSSLIVALSCAPSPGASAQGTPAPVAPLAREDRARLLNLALDFRTGQFQYAPIDACSAFTAYGSDTTFWTVVGERNRAVLDGTYRPGCSPEPRRQGYRRVYVQSITAPDSSHAVVDLRIVAAGRAHAETYRFGLATLDRRPNWSLLSVTVSTFVSFTEGTTMPTPPPARGHPPP
jgi:hypothetical protein